MNTANILNNRRGDARRHALALLLCLCGVLSLLLVFGPAPADAAAPKLDGSEARSYLTWINTTFGGVTKMNKIKVYAFEGETICLGSNVFNSKLDMDGKNSTGAGTDFGSIDIVIRDIYGNPTKLDVQKYLYTEGGSSHDESKNGPGFIKDYTMEQAIKNAEDLDDYTKAGYTPIKYPVYETGIYTIEFHSYNGKGAAADPGRTEKRQISSLYPR